GDAPRLACIALTAGGDGREVNDLFESVLTERRSGRGGVGTIAALPGDRDTGCEHVVNHHIVAARDELLDDVQADKARPAGDEDHFLVKPRIPEAAERGSRGAARPSSTRMKNSKMARLNASGSSMLMVWPDHGSTTSPLVAMWRFMRSPGSRQGSSSSPVMISVGAWIWFISPVSSQSEGRFICTPRMVSACPLAECSAS